MLCVEDALDSLKWAEQAGGLDALVARSAGNLAAVAAWVDASDWIDFLAVDPATRSSTSICLKVVDPWLTALGAADQAAATKAVAALIEQEGAGYDIGAYRDAPPGFRVWGGPTVERSDIEALLPWLDWAYAQIKNERAAA